MFPAPWPLRLSVAGKEHVRPDCRVAFTLWPFWLHAPLRSMSVLLESVYYYAKISSGEERIHEKEIRKHEDQWLAGILLYYFYHHQTSFTRSLFPFCALVSELLSTRGIIGFEPSTSSVVFRGICTVRLCSDVLSLSGSLTKVQGRAGQGRAGQRMIWALARALQLSYPVCVRLPHHASSYRPYTNIRILHCSMPDPHWLFFGTDPIPAVYYNLVTTE